MKSGLLAEFPSPELLVTAVEGLRAIGYRRLEAFTPYPVEAVEQALELPRSRLPLPVFGMAALGAGVAYFVQWWTSAYDYPLRVGGFPPSSPPAYIPIAFETTVLFAALATFVGLFVLIGLPCLWHPLFHVSTFERAAVDRFFVAVDARDERFDLVSTRGDLEALAPLSVRAFGATR